MKPVYAPLRAHYARITRRYQVKAARRSRAAPADDGQYNPFAFY
jgi:hypothetical protein